MTPMFRSATLAVVVLLMLMTLRPGRPAPE